MNIFLFDSENEINLNNLPNPSISIVATNKYSKAYEIIKHSEFCLFLINVTNNDLHWVKLITRIKELSSSPILTFSSYSEATNLSLLNLGVHWNIEKPFSISHLSNLINFYKSKIYKLKNFIFSNDLKCLWTHNQPKALTKKEVLILNTLIERRNHIVHRDILHDLITQYNDRGPVSLDFHMTNIRHKLGSHRGHLQTSYGYGYIWIEIL